MEIPNQEPDMPIPLNSSYGGNHGHTHMIHHDPTSLNHIIIPSSAPINGPIVPEDHHVSNFKKMVKYKECLKNHAAAMGGNATDGCGEFMPSGEEGSLEAFTCSACNCHRNFHRKEVDGDHQTASLLTISHENYYYPNVNPRIGRKIFLGNNDLGYHNHNIAAGGGLISSRPHGMIMSYNMGSLPSESEEEGGGGGGVRPLMVKKRYRTKFTQEQKEKMLSFAEKVGWKMQKQEEGVVQQFCQEIGVKRKVLKVWIHNNKHSLAKKNGDGNQQQQQQLNGGHEHQV